MNPKRANPHTLDSRLQRRAINQGRRETKTERMGETRKMDARVCMGSSSTVRSYAIHKRKDLHEIFPMNYTYHTTNAKIPLHYAYEYEVKTAFFLLILAKGFCSTHELTNSPVCALLEVNWTSGNTAKESWRERMTWERTRSFPTPLAPAMADTMAAGTMAMLRLGETSYCRCCNILHWIIYDLL